VDETGKWLDEGADRAVYDQHGRTLEGGFMTRLMERFRRERVKVGDDALNYRIQVLEIHRGDLTLNQEEDFEGFFEKVRVLLKDQFLRPRKSSSMPVAN